MSTSNAQQPDAEYTEVAESPNRGIARVDPVSIAPIELKANLVNALENDKAIEDFMRQGMKQDTDYGVIPGTKVPTLLQPGGEKLCRLFNLGTRYEQNVRYLDGGHIDVDVTAFLFQRSTGAEVGSASGSASSMESKWRYRHAERVCPACGQSAIIKGKVEYGGGWLCYKNKGGCGAKYDERDPAIVDQPLGLVENPNIADLWNTVKKIAAKRAKLSAVKDVLGGSGLFTVDLEDMRENEAVHSRPPRENGNANPNSGGNRSRVDADFEGVVGEYADYTIVGGEEKQNARGQAYIAYIVSREGKTGYVSCWDPASAEIALDTDNPAGYRGPARLLLSSRAKEGKTFWDIKQFYVGEPMDAMETPGA